MSDEPTSKHNISSGELPLCPIFVLPSGAQGDSQLSADIESLIQEHFEMHQLNALAVYTAFLHEPDSSLAQHWLYLSDRVSSILQLPRPQALRLDMRKSDDGHPPACTSISRDASCVNHWVWTTTDSAGVISIDTEGKIVVHGPLSRTECLDYLSTLRGRIIDCSQQLAIQLQNQFNYAAQLRTRLKFYAPLLSDDHQAFKLQITRVADGTHEAVPLSFILTNAPGAEDYLPSGDLRLSSLPTELEGMHSLLSAINYALNDGGALSMDFTTREDGSWAWGDADPALRATTHYRYQVVASNAFPLWSDTVLRFKAQRHIPDQAPESQH